jgi:flagellar biosynthesis protein FlhF
MNVRKFIAVNAREALRKVKETLGPDAIILSNRGVPGGVEIMAVAARDMAMIVPPVEERPRPAPMRLPSMAPLPDEEADYRVSLSRARTSMTPNVARPAPQPAPRPAPQPVPQAAAPVFNAPLRQQQATPTPPAARRVVNAGIPKSEALRQMVDHARQEVSERAFATGVGQHDALYPQDAARRNDAIRPHNAIRQDAEVVPVSVVEEIRSLRKIVEQHLAGFAWGEVARTEPVKTEVLRQMLDAGFSPQFAREILCDLPPEMDTLRAMAWVRGAADRSLFTLDAGCDIIDRGGVYALLGPTGVGKTTTAAKLAARCVLRHGADKVALVTTDGYRIGAHEQLRIYGRILGITVYLAKDADELRQVLGELRAKHMVLIDTMGMSQKDRLVVELNAMLSECAVRRLLVLSATSRGDTQDDVVRAYRGDDLSGCILTKVDETVSLASALDAIMRHGLVLHYVSNGQRVPEDLHLPNRAYLLHRAFKEVPEAAHRYDGVEHGLMMANAGLAAGGRHG